MQYFLEGEWTTINGENSLIFRPVFDMLDTFLFFIDDKVVGMIQATGNDYGYSISVLELFNESFRDTIPDKIYTENDEEIIYNYNRFIRLPELVNQ